MDIKDSIVKITGVGEKRARQFHKIKIRTVGDLLYHFPRDYKDYSKYTGIKKFGIGQEVMIKATVESIRLVTSARQRIKIVQAKLVDKEGESLYAVWFNQPFLVKNIPRGSTWIFDGKISYDFASKRKTLSSPIYTKKTSIVPIYPETEGLNSKYIAKCVRVAYELCEISDPLPEKIKNKYDLIDLNQAISKIHFPKKEDDILSAKYRLSFDEILNLSLEMLKRRRSFQSHKSCTCQIEKSKLIEFEKSLPFKLTGAQSKSVYEITHDMIKDIPMTRLLNGDVGSGKTVVAAISSYLSVLNNYQVAFMAPTEILANQHYESLRKLFKKFPDIKIGLLTSNTKKISDSDKLHNTSYVIQNSNIVVGTHSLIQKDVKFKNLGLVIVDEEHRFGVKQRATLIKKNAKKDAYPHYLSMTATPIPRTLAYSLYADLDISVLDELPPTRKEIITRHVDPINRDDAYKFIRAHIKNGRQVFVICPLIEEKEEPDDKIKLLELEKKSVIAEYQKLRTKIFPDFSIFMLHGKMSSDEKNSIMSKFSSGKIDVLVSTSVIEVGIDIPNANIMIIEDADRFGLAQLHQFRGRIGRGEHKSFCFLFSNNNSEKAKKRLEQMEKYSDGFKLAQMDLLSRGPGQFIGAKQSGFSELKLADITDLKLLNKAKEAANWVLDHETK